MFKKIMIAAIIMASPVQHAASRDEAKLVERNIATVIGAAASESKCRIGSSCEEGCTSLLMPTLMQDEKGRIFIVPSDKFKQSRKRSISF